MANLQVYISNLRRVIRPGAGAASPIVRRALGYYLDVDAEQIDLAVFEQRCLAARAAAGSGDWTAALSAAEAALELWDGPLLEDMRDEDWVRQDAVRVDDMHAECMEHHVASLLAVGRMADAPAPG